MATKTFLDTKGLKMKKKFVFTITVDWEQNHSSIADCATVEDIDLSIRSKMEELRAIYSNIKNIDVVLYREYNIHS